MLQFKTIIHPHAEDVYIKKVYFEYFISNKGAIKI